MILEAAILNVKEHKRDNFEETFRKASKIIEAIPGYIQHTLNKCLEEEGKYLLLVEWQNLEDHTIGFRESEAYKEWKALLHHYYEPFPTVEHFEKVDLANS
ncbi:antibiotic biosynthesis monooxygenase [Staphylococcus sp. ACRSN]|uniref:antibiotic biosynthesis monooxygenase family protein n=1 Tax=Staphylococcus sp. ACRSN TaxID=2918214 RepID=UPI001EF19A7D|nr:antibiotic biosynthesis monooxygenase [Staphylococcus sp. ACRSN]MCG7338982.1 antibiotic biosynthesis monooxygenase [Staphylococcus sp. ACRSN]